MDINQVLKDHGMIASERDIEQLNKDIGDVSLLTTAAQNNIVAAVNALDGQVTDHVNTDDRHVSSGERSYWNNKSDSDHTHDELHGHTNKGLLDKLGQTGTETSFDLSSFVTGVELDTFNFGDMDTSTYDVNNSGKVDVAEDADRLGGQTPDVFATKTYVTDELGAINYPVDSVNGKIGDVTLTAGDVDAETAEGAQSRADQAEQNAKDYVIQQFDTLVFPVTTVNGKNGDVELFPSDIGAYSKIQTDNIISSIESNANDYTDSQINALGTASEYDVGHNAGNVPLLTASGKLDPNIFPAIALTDIFVRDTFNDLTTLDAQRGDMAILTQDHETYILRIEPATDASNWQLIESPLDAVNSVNGKTGTVTLGPDDVGAETPEGAQTKADAALADAKTYADQAETDANTYTDNQINAIDYPVDSVNGYTDTVVLGPDDVGAETPQGAQTKVDAHADRTDNPHAVTSKQVVHLEAFTKNGGDAPSTYPFGYSVTTVSSSEGWPSNGILFTNRAETAISEITHQQFAPQDNTHAPWVRTWDGSAWSAWTELETKSEADTKISNAETSANMYTDNQIAAIDYPVDSVNGYTDTVVLGPDDVGAETPTGAQTKADSAETSANTYTDNQIAAIDYPVDSVNGYTDIVELNAADVGAETPSGAQSKADSAELAANNYTDTHEGKSNPHGITTGKIGAETPTAAQTKADNAEAAAKSYTDTEIAAINFPVDSVNGFTGVVSLGAGDVGAETPTGAQSKADNAETDANSYTDTQITNHKNDGTIHITSAERTTWNSKADGDHTHSELHAHSNFNVLERLIQSGSETEFDLSKFATISDMQEQGYGDMMQSMYDANGNGIVDDSEDAVRLGGVLAEEYATKAHVTTEIGNITPTDIGASTSGHRHANATTAADGFISMEDKGKLNGIEYGAEVNTVTSVNTQTGDISLTATDVGAETPSGAQSKADSAETSAKSYTDTEVSSHAGDAVAHITSTERTTWNSKAEGDHTHSELHTHANKAVVDKLTQSGTETSFDLSAFVTDAELGDAGYGDMTKGAYDSNDDGVVDQADDALALGGTPAADYATESYVGVQIGNITPSDIGAATSSHDHANATTTVDGFMAAGDKSKLDNIESGAQVNDVTSVNGETGSVSLGAADIGAETPAGAQSKANAAETAANTYTDNQLSGHTHEIADVNGLQTAIDDAGSDNVTDNSITFGNAWKLEFNTETGSMDWVVL